MRLLMTLLLVVCLGIVAMAQDTPADNWSQFRGNQQLTGVSQSKVPESLKPLWTYDAGDSIESPASYVHSGFSDSGTFDCDTPVNCWLPRNCDQLSAGVSWAIATMPRQTTSSSVINRRIRKSQLLLVHQAVWD